MSSVSLRMRDSTPCTDLLNPHPPHTKLNHQIEYTIGKVCVDAFATVASSFLDSDDLFDKLHECILHETVALGGSLQVE